jgi:dTDP-4-dehydrorhamnose reductase
MHPLEVYGGFFHGFLSACSDAILKGILTPKFSVMAKKVIVLGSLGMLGQELVKAFAADPAYEVRGIDRSDFDVLDFGALGAYFESEAPSLVLNAVAYNAVDQAEEDAAAYEEALRLNRDLPEFLASESVRLGFTLVHYSSDYVFDGTLEAPEEKRCQGACCGGNCHGSKAGYAEDALPNPLSRYGETKLAGEEEVRTHAKDYYVIRLSRLFGKPAASAAGKRSFFEVMLALAETKPEVHAVDAEQASFTYAPDLAEATKRLCEESFPAGTYHLVNEDGATWYGAAEELFRQAGIATPLFAARPEDFPRPARRPAFSVLQNTKFPPLRPYQEALAEYLHNR